MRVCFKNGGINCVLRDIELIKQDGRSVRAGAVWKDEDAVYYTNTEKRTVPSSRYKCH